MAFGSCSRSQLILIFGNTMAFFLAGTLLGYAIFVFSYMRTLNPGVIVVCLGASVGIMIMTSAGAWGSLLKKHGVLKVYFYSVFLLNIVLLVTGTLAYISANEMESYVKYKYRTVANAMPDSECDFDSTTTAAGISQCKTNMQNTLEDNLRYIGACCILMAVIMIFGLVTSGRLLTWDRLTVPLLHGGGIVMIAFGILNTSFALSTVINENSALVGDAWATFVAVGCAALVIVLGVIGISAMQKKSSWGVLVYQVVGFISIILLAYLSVMAFFQCADITGWTSDNFDSGKDLRSKLESDSTCFCNNNDYDYGCMVKDNPNCNAKNTTGFYLYYTCTKGASGGIHWDTCSLDTTNTVAVKYCLPTDLCIDKAADGPQASLAAIGTMSGFYIIYLVMCLAASFNVRARLIEAQQQQQEDGVGVGMKTNV